MSIKDLMLDCVCMSVFGRNDIGKFFHFMSFHLYIYEGIYRFKLDEPLIT